MDVVVLGASALTAREVCRYLDRRAAEVGLSWGAAGRDQQRVGAALAAAGATADAVLRADVTDPASLTELARRADVVLNLVGPYARSAEAVIAACIEQGTHYLDLTGETLFMQRMIARYDAAARARGVRIVQPCGFESLPVDLLLGLAWDAADAADDTLVGLDVAFSIERLPRGLRPGDAVSGGTIRSLVEMVDDQDVARAFDPALLITDEARAAAVRSASPLRLRPGRSGRRALAPFLPAPTINPPVLHRTTELLDRPVLSYREGTRVPGPIVATLPAAAATSVFYGATRALTRFPAPVRAGVGRVLDRVLPASGSGPSPDRVQDWRWRLDGVGRLRSDGTVRVGVTGTGHPGYLTTAHMAAEAALLLARPDALPERAGLLTPLAALGTGVVHRFAPAGLVFDD